MKTKIYVRLSDSRVGELLSMDSRDEDGKYLVLVKGENKPIRWGEAKEISPDEYEQATKPVVSTKAPSKRGAKK